MTGTVIRERSARIARGLPTTTGTFFLAGPSEKGVTDQAIPIRNLAEFIRRAGNRVAYSTAYDIADAYFGRGGGLMYFSRDTGPAAATATANAPDAGAVTSLVISANSPGAWGNAVNYQILAGDVGGEYKVEITNDNDPSVLDQSPSFATQADAVAWGANSDYVRIALGPSANVPAPGAVVSLAGGANDTAGLSDATAQAALDRFGRALGPGQVAFSDRRSSVAHGQLADHCVGLEGMRVALFDTADTNSKTTLLTGAAADRALTNSRHGALFGPWIQIGALAPGAAPRSVPASAAVAAAIARNDAIGVVPNQPAGGDFGILDDIVDINARFSDADADELQEAGVNLIRDRAGDFKIYGYRSAVSKIAQPNWWQFGNVRLYMAIAAEADNILDRFVLRQIDGRGHVFKELEGLLIGMLLPFFDAGALYGATPDEAFFVDTGPAVNTADTISNGEIHAALELTMSPMGETVVLDIVKRMIGA